MFRKDIFGRNYIYGQLKTENPMSLSEGFIAKSAFAEMDCDGDGFVSKAEFVTACLSQEELTNMLALKVFDTVILIY